MSIKSSNAEKLNTENNTSKLHESYLGSKTSFSRLWRQFVFVPILHNRWLDDNAKLRLTQAVTQAEQGHRGEVFILIENHLPIPDAYYIGCRERAVNIFSEYRVWDTEENTGVLVYVNICEHDLEIVADRGINAHVEQAVWQTLCDETLLGMKKGEMEASLIELLGKIGDLLRKYYHLEHDPQGNELADAVVFLR